MKLSLKNNWNIDSNYGKFIADVPFSITKVLLDNKVIEDPYFRDNEEKTQEIFKHDYLLSRSFTLSKVQLKKPIYLVIDEIDTYASIKVNDIEVLITKSMHETYRVRLNNLINGTNKIEITLYSPYKYLNESANSLSLFRGFSGYTNNFPRMRKAHSSFGWDWGITLPDMGIYSDIYLDIEYVGSLIEFRHNLVFDDSSVDINIKTKYQITDKSSILTLVLYSPNKEIVEKVSAVAKSNNLFSIHLNNPLIWMPKGYGNPNLYKLDLILEGKEDKVIDSKLIGIKKLEVIDKKDKVGKPLIVRINGIDIFLKGADYIPMDAIYPNVTEEKIDRLISLVKDFNHNTIRVWGGGVYPGEYFFNRCDEEGIMVFEDLMFACATYDSSDQDFMSLIKEETTNVLRRIRHHASIILISGNNECEEAITNWLKERKEEHKKSYTDIFLLTLKNIVKKETDFYYLSSSPTSGSPYFVNPQDDNNLDRHCWDVWHGRKQIEYFYSIKPRLLSEFGLQSYPSINMVKKYATETDMDMNSKVMLAHQKNKSGNELIYKYILDSFKTPKDFKSLVYLSQLSQEEAVSLCVHHLRAIKPLCMGVIYWQLNDNWPVQSWSSIDYDFNLKMLHYASKKFYSPIILSFEPKLDGIDLYVVSDELTDRTLKLEVSYNSIDGESAVLTKEFIEVPHLKSTLVLSLDLISDSTHFYQATLISKNEVIAKEEYYFSKMKDLNLKDPKITIKKIDDKSFEVKATEFAYHVFLTTTDPSLIFSDNSFTLLKNETKRIESNKDIDVNKISITSLFDTY